MVFAEHAPFPSPLTFVLSFHNAGGIKCKSELVVLGGGRWAE